MDRQAAYDLFITGLEKKGLKGIDLRKEVPGLLAWGYAKGVFANPHTVHEITEWRTLGDRLWEAVLEDDKTAKKLGKVWRTVHNALLQQEAEKRAAEGALAARRKNTYYGREDEPLAPGVTTVVLPAPGSAGGPAAAQSCLEPSAPPLEEPGKEKGIPGGPLGDEPDPVPGAQSDLWGEMVKQRKEAWAALAKHGLESGDVELVEVAGTLACPVTYTLVVDQNGQVVNHLGTFTPLDWKLLAELRQTVAQFGPKSEPVKQMLDYMFNTMLLLPNDLRGLTRLIFTPHQQLLFNAHWQALVQESVATQRQPGDPLHGVTLDELMGLGPYLRTDAQMISGPDKVREAMRLVRTAIDRVKDSTGVPLYMGIKQGRDEPFGSFVDKAAAAIERAGVPEYMKGALLKQCAPQNSNEETKRVLATLGANWSIEEALERMALQPTGQQAFLVSAIRELGLGLQKQAESTQNQVLAALAPLRASTAAPATAGNNRRPPSAKCYRCGQGGHMRKNCRTPEVWCQNCQSGTHNTSACRRRTGNSQRSANGSRAPTQIAAAESAPPPVYNQPPQGAWDLTWQQQ
ncbi:GAK8 protein, partial [Rhagologus leucostigma]|nr:GAK8 protein [Rhagologus leucostigma]